MSRKIVGILVVMVIVTGGNVFAKSPAKPTPVPRKLEGFAVTTPDGFDLIGKYFPPASKDKPVVILLHQLGADMGTWDVFAENLQKAGYGTFAYDARGHGESTMKKGKRTTWSIFASRGVNNDWNKMTSDLALIVKTLAKKKKADAKNIVIIGASIGANTVLKYAAQNKDIRAIALLSPGLSYRDVVTEPAARAYAGRSCFIACSKDDAYSYTSCRRLKEILDKGAGKKKSQAVLEVRRGRAHGTYMLGGNLDSKLLNWLAEKQKSKAPRGASVNGQMVISTPDHFNLNVHYTCLKQIKKPTVILLHQIGENISSWTKFGNKLRHAGFNSVAYDARGHGLAIKGQWVIKGTHAWVLDNEHKVTWKDFAPTGEDNDWNKMTDDLSLVVNAMKRRAEFDEKKIVLIGAGIGANIVLKYAAKNKDIRGIILLSPGLNYKDVKTEPAAHAWDGRPCFIACSRGDSYSYESCLKLKKILEEKVGDKNSQIVLEIRDGSTHGTDMLGGELDSKLLHWLKDVLK